jgi:hypothetical protein
MELLEGLHILLNGGIITGICILSGYILKYLVVLLICKTPQLSDDKVKSITKMISKDTKFHLPNSKL